MHHLSPTIDNESTEHGGADRCSTGLLVLTLNLGLLRYRLWRDWHIPINRFISERLRAAPAALAKVNADIVALQEVYHDADRDALIAGLRELYPHVAEAPRRRSFVGSGLLVLSKYQVRNVEFLVCQGAPRWSHPFWMQGLLLVRIDVPNFGRVRMINVHLAPSIPRCRAEISASVANRAREIAQLVSVASAEAGPGILIGDFNASEAICPAIYSQILATGYEDSFVSVRGLPRASAATWDPANPLNTAGPFMTSPMQRIDHVFVRGDAAGTITPASADIVLRERSVAVGGGRSVPLSDHYGVLVGLRFQRCGRNIIRSIE